MRELWMTGIMKLRETQPWWHAMCNVIAVTDNSNWWAIYVVVDLLSQSLGRIKKETV